MADLLSKLTPKKDGSYAEITQQLYLKNLELAQTNKTLALLRTIDLHVLDSKKTVASLITLISDELMISNNYAFLCIITRSELSETEYYLQDVRSSAMTEQPKLQERYLRASIDGNILAECRRLNGQEVPVEGELLSELFQEPKLAASLLRELKKIGVSQLMVNTLNAGASMYGVIIAGYRDQAMITPAEREFLARISQACGVALDNKFLNSRLQKLAHKLQVSNTRLKELDETKDDFISMASHQLRTPLTSIKGYLSMVLEGDAGDVNETQRKMLSQAFTSSQHMVYLIADLLNVSRLKTGKFIIEPKPTDLSQMIDEEIDQLKETALSRSVELTFEKPDKFPSLMLDETKTRQVLMNFIDNAIYYTPKDGHIKIELQDTGSTVEFRVIDDGIGVPKSEQHHLFTKFYRAGNARKARPDGTGLGLFMAKKVITAQNGVIIFNSKEGKGSTFGFSFAKSKLEQPPSLPTPETKRPVTQIKG